MSLGTSVVASQCIQQWRPPDELSALGDEMVRDLAGLFQGDTSQNLERMAEFLSALDFDRLQAGAHRIKGGAGQMGLFGLVRLCQEFEHAAEERCLSGSERGLSQLGQCFAETCQQ